MVTAVLHFLGSPQVGVVELTEQAKDGGWYKCDSNGRPYIFDDVDKAYSDAKYAAVVPNSARWVISFVIPQSGITKYELCVLGNVGSRKGYSDGSIMTARLQKFLRMLGYQGITSSCGGNNVGLGVLAGNGEHSRVDYLCHPVYGTLVRYAQFLVTDLPLTPTKPIDAGIFRFCKTCLKCANVCPSGSIDTSTEPSWEGTGPWNGYGLKSWHINYKTCLPWRGFPGGANPGACANCQSYCVFSKCDKASIHGIIRAAVAATPIFNGFFKVMDDAFGYPDKLDPEAWWDRDLDAFPYKGWLIET